MRNRTSSHRPRRTIALVLLALAILPVVVALQAAWAITRPRLDATPDFDLAMTVGDDRAGETLVVHVLGDSTVAGVGADRAEETLPAQVAIQASSELDRPIRVVAHGVTGARTIDAVDQLEKVPGEGVDAIVIEIGSNDVTHLTSLEDVEEQTRELLERARERAPIVVLGSAGKLNTPNFHQPLRWLVMARATAVRERQREVARDLGVPFMDVAKEVSPAFEEIGPQANSSDEFHPSALGYEAWARPLAARLVKAVSERER